MEKNKIIVLNDYRTAAQESPDDSGVQHHAEETAREAAEPASEGRVVRKRKIRVKRMKVLGGTLLAVLLLFGISWLLLFSWLFNGFFNRLLLFSWLFDMYPVFWTLSFELNN